MSVAPQKSGAKYNNGKKCAICGLRKSGNMIMHCARNNEELRKLWSKAVNKELFPSSLICSNHFRETDYQYVARLLKSGSVPTIQLNRNNIRVKDDAFLKNTRSLNTYETMDSSNEQIVDTDSEIYLSDQRNENNDSEEELCYVYYLDEEQKVQSYEHSARHERVRNISNNSSDSNQIISLLNTRIRQENSPSDMELDATQSIGGLGREDQRRIFSNKLPH